MSQSPNNLSRFSLRTFLPFFLRKNTGFTRRHERQDCVLIGTMRVVDIGAEFDGMLVELSLGGCAFRTASMYLLDRLGELVSIRTEYFELEGRIRAVRPGSYGIQFFGEIDPRILDRVVAEHGGKIADSFLAKRN